MRKNIVSYDINYRGRRDGVRMEPQETVMKMIEFSMESVAATPQELHLVPLGRWADRDFEVTVADCEAMVANFERFGIRLVVDYEHQSLNCEENGAPSPAAGWIGALETRENGLWGRDVEWTQKAREMIEAREYRYLSPVIVFDDKDPHSGELIGCTLHSVALTNTPYFRSDLEPIAAKRGGAAVDENNDNGANSNSDDKEIRVTEQEQQALKAENERLTAEITSLRAELAQQAEAAEAAETARMVEEAITAKRLLPGQKEVALIVAKQGKDVLEKFISASVVPDLEKKQDVPEAESKGGLKYEDLLADPVRMQKMKNETPEAFEALRRAFYGGE